MEEHVIDEIKRLEEELRLAMLDNNVSKLDELINDSLVFTTPDGNVATKNMDLEAHRNKTQKMSELTPSDQNIKVYDNSAVVTVRMKITGTFNGIDISGLYQYLRVWQKTNEKWSIIAGSVTKVMQ